jgi:hypothetical protein
MSKKLLTIRHLYSKFITLFLLFIFSNTYSLTPDNNWKLYRAQDGIEIYYATEECHDFANGTHYEYIILKFVNTTSTAKKITWSEILYYNGKCTGCDEKSDKPLYTVELNANESKEGGCGKDDGDTFRIFNRFLNYTDKPTLTKYELMNLIVTDR